MKTPVLVAKSLRIIPASLAGLWQRLALVVKLGRGRPVLCIALIVPFFPWLTSGIARADDLDQATSVFSCMFQRTHDKNADRQPDAWRRRRDRAHPSFIQAQIVPRDPVAYQKAKVTEATTAKLYHLWQTGKWDPQYFPEVTPPELASLMDATLLNDCFEVRMNGGEFEIASPRFDVDSRFHYVLEAEVATDELDQHAATVELRLLDSQDQVVAAYSTRPIQGTQPWIQLRTDNAAIQTESKVRGEILIRVHSTNKQFGRGIARFDNIRLNRLPTLFIKSNVPNNVAPPNSKIEFSCFAAGLLAENNLMELEVLDVDGNVVYQKSLPLSRSNNSDIPAGNLVSRSNRNLAQVKEEKASTVFPLVLKQPGQYFVHAKLGQSQQQVLFTILEQTPAIKSPFGISLETIPQASEIPSLLKLIQLTRSSWVKLPIWCDANDADARKATTLLARGLRQLGVATVGRLDRPPVSQFENFEEDPSRTQATSHLQDPRIWEPLLDPVLSEVNTLIDFLQLGSNTDFSFVGNPNAAKVLEQVRVIMQYYFQETKFVVASDWLTPKSVSTGDPVTPPFYAIHYSTRPQLTVAELKRYASAHNQQPTKVWASIDPLPKSTYSLEDRVIDLLGKMIAVKQVGIQAAFSTSPLNQQTGLFDSQLLPTDMLVPWTRVIAAIGNRTFIGSVELPHGSQNVTFQGAAGDVMIVWNSRPVVEELFFGDNISANDIWGRPVDVENTTTNQGAQVQRIKINKWPVILAGVDSDIIRWRQEFQVLVDHITSNLSSGSTLPIQLQNTLPSRVKGSLLLESPNLLKNAERKTRLDVEPGRVEKLGIPLEFLPNASAGLHSLNFQFQLQANKDYSFSVRRNMRLGHPDIDIRWDIIRLNNAMAEAQVELINNTSKSVNFDCTFFPANQTYIRVALPNCSPGTTSFVHQLAIPKPVDGEVPPIWIRCAEIQSPLTLNYLVEVKQPKS